MKQLKDLTDYTSVLPYASELFGVYQPLLGWKSTRASRRFKSKQQINRQDVMRMIVRHFRGDTAVQYLGREDHAGPCDPPKIKINVGALAASHKRPTESILLRAISDQLPALEDIKDDAWRDFINPDRLKMYLGEFVAPHYSKLYSELCNQLANLGDRNHSTEDLHDSLKNSIALQLDGESSTAAVLEHLHAEKRFSALKNLFYVKRLDAATQEQLTQAIAALDDNEDFLDLAHIDPQNRDHIRSVALSPISVVHLYRQYFFELDTFLGTPVNHVWLSPGSTVELIETHTLRTLTERTQEQSTETILKTEHSRSEKEELSETTKQDNKQDIKLGASVTASYASITATGSFDFASSQQAAREKSYKHMREQSDKLSSEIRQNYKSTFRTVTETTDTSSKRYLLTNTTKDLINYELRRKMRQVGVQVQDVGTYLCWQTYVDDAGADLGVSELVHIAKKPEIGEPPNPENVPIQTDFTQDIAPIPLAFIPTNDHYDKGEDYDYGAERNDSDPKTKYRIVYTFPQTVSCEKPEYSLDAVQLQVTDGNATVEVSDLKAEGTRGTFTIVLKHAHFGDRESIMVKPTLFWKSTQDVSKIEAVNNAKMTEFQEKERKAYKDAYITAARDRVKLASKITQRPSIELREEERIVVYRRLVQGMLMKGIDFPDDATRHVVAELINNIFDVDKMLYFVAPEWWRPRLHQSHQSFGKFVGPTAASVSAATGAASATVAKILSVKSFANVIALGKGNSVRERPLNEHASGWGGLKENRPDNYYITEDSEPARLGSSLGWLLQLDGDNVRNAFLNAPWVKAVIPVRPGKEEEAINWLKGVEGFNGITDADIYRTKNADEKDINGTPLDGQKLIDVILDLAKKIKRKHEEGVIAGKYPKPQELDKPELVDEGNTVTTTPVDRVYEHGFYPLKGGFKAKMEQHYDMVAQWIEVLPTDQIVPVEVQYDRRTGRMLP